MGKTANTVAAISITAALLTISLFAVNVWGGFVNPFSPQVRATVTIVPSCLAGFCTVDEGNVFVELERVGTLDTIASQFSLMGQGLVVFGPCVGGLGGGDFQAKLIVPLGGISGSGFRRTLGPQRSCGQPLTFTYIFNVPKLDSLDSLSWELEIRDRPGTTIFFKKFGTWEI